MCVVAPVRAQEDANAPAASPSTEPPCLDIDTSNVEILRQPCKDPAMACDHDNGCVCVPNT